MIFGTVLIIAALSLFLWNRYQDRKAGDAADKILLRIEEQIERNDNGGTDPVDLYDNNMTEMELDGNKYIGYLSLPSLGLELPVMSEWSYPGLRISPCRYSGSAKTNNLVIAAHNYSRHFGYIKNLIPGDRVTFTDMDGIITEYQVTEVDTLNPAAVKEVTDSGYALTLFTCTYGGQNRVVVRCDTCDESESSGKSNFMRK